MDKIGKDIFHIAKKMQDPDRGVLTGFSDLDAMTLGFHAGEFIIIAGRPSMGKSSLLLQIARQMKRPVGIASIEMNRQMVGERLISQVSGVGLHTIKSARMREVDKISAGKALKEIEDKDIYVLDNSFLTPDMLEAEIRDLDLSCVFVDYLQLLTIPDSYGSGEREVGLISKSLKAMALKLDIPIVVASQLNRESERRESHVPYLSDLRGSGSLEQDSDVVMLLHRPAYYRITGDDPDAEDDGQAWIYLAKNRSGPVGKIEYKWNKYCMNFEERSAKFKEFGGLL